MRTSRFLIVVAACALLGHAVVSADVDPKKLNKANKMVQKGERAMKSGNLPSAKEAFQGAVDLVSSFPNAQIGLGQIAMHEKRFDEALGHYRKAQAGYNEHGRLLLDLQAKRYNNAQRDILELHDAIQELERNAGGTGELPPQSRHYRSVLENQISTLEAIQPPRHDDSADMAPGEIYFYIGNALFQAGKTEEAVTAWETCREKSPKFPMVYNNLALAYWRAGRLDDAKASLAKAEELGFPVNPQFKADLAAAS